MYVSNTFPGVLIGKVVSIGGVGSRLRNPCRLQLKLSYLITQRLAVIRFRLFECIALELEIRLLYCQNPVLPNFASFCQLQTQVGNL